MIVIHHNKDLDGFASGAVCKHKYPYAKLIGWDYKDPLPDFEQFRDEEVIMIDISFPVEDMEALAEIALRLTVIDHHISFYKDVYTAFGSSDRIPFIYVYELGVAACEIGWKHLFPGQPVPYAITLLGRYDTWRQNEGNWEGETLPFQYAMRIECTSPETFNKNLLVYPNAVEEQISERVRIGESVLEYQKQQDMLACERSSFERTIAGKKAICLNTRFFSSNTMVTVYDPSKHDLMVGIEYTGDKWSVSLRSAKDDVDVSLIAKSKGGGGHKAAAGFEADTLEEIFS